MNKQYFWKKRLDEKLEALNREEKAVVDICFKYYLKQNDTIRRDSWTEKETNSCDVLIESSVFL